MRLRSALFGLCRVLALLLLPIVGKPQCSCSWTYRYYQIDGDRDDGCWNVYTEVRAYYCGYYEWSSYYYDGSYCNENGPRK